MLPDEPVLHVCLAGHKVARDCVLIRRLESRHAVTLIDAIEKLAGSGVPGDANVLVLDCTDCAEQARKCLSALKEQAPALCVVVVEGNFDQKQVAGMFRDGIRDYFPAPYDPVLLAERVGSLCGRPGTPPAANRRVPSP